MIKEQILCFYHDDLDGVLSAAIVKKKYKDTHRIKFISVQYGDDFDYAKLLYEAANSEMVFLVDFSFEKEFLIDLLTIGNLIWIDHHKTAKEKLEGLWNSSIKGNRKLTNSGCMLTWLHLFDKPAPMAVKLVEDRDLWKFDYEETKLFNDGLSTYSFNPKLKIWDRLLNDVNDELIDEICRMGKVLYEAKMKRCQRAFDIGYDTYFNGLYTRVMNTNHDISDLGNFAIERGYELALIWRYVRNRYVISLRSKNGEAKLIAEKYGGGGHPNAAGFAIDSLHKIEGLK